MRRQPEIAGRTPIKGASKYSAVRLWLGIEKPVIIASTLAGKRS